MYINLHMNNIYTVKVCPVRFRRHVSIDDVTATEVQILTGSTTLDSFCFFA